MLIFLKIAQLVAAAVWFGSICFFSFFAAPAIFKTLPKETAGTVISAVISRYYLLGMFSGAAAVASSVLINLKPEGQGLLEISKTVLLVFMFICTLYAGTVLHNDIRDVKAALYSRPAAEQTEKLEADFKSLHRRSVILNCIALVGGLLVLIVIGSQLKS